MIGPFILFAEKCSPFTTGIDQKTDWFCCMIESISETARHNALGEFTFENIGQGLIATGRQDFKRRGHYQPTLAHCQHVLFDIFVSWISSAIRVIYGETEPRIICEFRCSRSVAPETKAIATGSHIKACMHCPLAMAHGSETCNPVLKCRSKKHFHD